MLPALGCLCTPKPAWVRRGRPSQCLDRAPRAASRKLIVTCRKYRYFSPLKPVKSARPPLPPPPPPPPPPLSPPPTSPPSAARTASAPPGEPCGGTALLREGSEKTSKGGAGRHGGATPAPFSPEARYLRLQLGGLRVQLLLLRGRGGGGGGGGGRLLPRARQRRVTRLGRFALRRRLQERSEKVPRRGPAVPPPLRCGPPPRAAARSPPGRARRGPPTGRAGDASGTWLGHVAPADQSPSASAAAATPRSRSASLSTAATAAASASSRAASSACVASGHLDCELINY